MTAATMQQTPAIPPRPARGAGKDIGAASIPKIPPRPVNKRLERSVSPSVDRFAPSPLNEGIIPKNAKSLYPNPSDAGNGNDDPIERSGSVAMPSVGEEGAEYNAVTQGLEQEQEAKSRSASPEQTRHVGDDLKLHAPKPSLPAHSAKQRVMTVTRTDSDKAASFGIGRPSMERTVSRDSVKKKPSSTFSNSSDLGHHTDDEHGIPEIGQRVPMNPHLGDVQAPSPAPGSEGFKKHHRKHSSRGVPPGSYGLHGHGVANPDKLEKAYYEKHPELLEKEQYTPIHDRQNDYAMSSSDLNKLVRDTASRGAGVGTHSEIRGTPTDEAAFQASEEYASRISSPRPASAHPKAEPSPLVQTFKAEVTQPDDDKPIHVDDSTHPECRSYGEAGDAHHNEQEYSAPILASDETSKDPNVFLQHPAVHPPLERRGSAFEMEDAPSRPISRPASIIVQPSHEFDSTPLEDVEEYEPLFPDDKKDEKEKRGSPDENKQRRQFPSKDIWEDAPNSVHYTAEVSTPDVSEPLRRKSSTHNDKRPITPAQAFAQHQEELAEKKVKGAAPPSFLPLSEDKSSWNKNHTQPRQDRPAFGNRFPSRDVWEDAPESQLQETTLSGSAKEEATPGIPARPAKKSPESSERPHVPERPKPKQTPPVSDKPKPQVPARPSRGTPAEAKDGEVAKAKPPVPSRPVGGKIAALQAGFMSDLNKRLQLGPQVVKKEEPTEQKDLTQEKEKAPLSDARKGRARGPQRRAPAKSPAPAPATATAPAADAAKVPAPTLTFSLPQTAWAIDPEEGSVEVETQTEEIPAPVEVTQPVPELEKAAEPEKPQTDGVSEPEKLLEAKVEAEAEAEAEAKTETEVEATKLEEAESEDQTLVANAAGETVLEETVEKEDGSVEPVAVSDEVKS